MHTLPNVLESKTKIRFQHCDPFNHLNNGSYIDYFMNHREDALIENYDLDIYKIAKTTGKSWVSSSNQIAYLKPAFLMETVAISSQLIKFNDSELVVEMRMYDELKSHIKSVIWCSFVHFNLLEQKREFHAAKFMDIFKQVHNPLKETSFDERITFFKAKKALF
ncbi:acyl-CoA thioesterase [Flavobacteriaceae bacterium MHTCC 0001]